MVKVQYGLVGIGLCAFSLLEMVICCHGMVRVVCLGMWEAQWLVTWLPALPIERCIK